MPKAADRAAQLKARMNQETQQRSAAPPIDDRAARAHFVGTTVLDQLTNGRTVQAIPVEQIAPELQEGLRQPRLLPLPEELRPNGEWDETNQPLIDELLALGRSLQARQIQPIVVYPGTSTIYTAAQYLIAAGHRRWTAAVLLGMATIDAVVIDPPTPELDFIHLVDKTRMAGYARFRPDYQEGKNHARPARSYYNRAAAL
jgi:hypothetical protein